MKSEIIFLIVAVLFSAVQWAADRQKKAQKKERKMREGGTGEQAGRLRRMREERAGERRFVGQETSEEERVRKFMEALGLPTDGPVPAPTPAARPKPAPTPEPPPAPVVAKEEPVPLPSEERRPAVSQAERTFPKPRRPRQPDRSFPTPPPSPYRHSKKEKKAREPRPSVVPGLSAPVTASISEISAPVELESFSFSGKEPSPGSEPLIDFSSPRALRRALVMGEVLGRPKGLA